MQRYRQREAVRFGVGCDVEIVEGALDDIRFVFREVRLQGGVARGHRNAVADRSGVGALAQPDIGGKLIAAPGQVGVQTAKRRALGADCFGAVIVRAQEQRQRRRFRDVHAQDARPAPRSGLDVRIDARDVRIPLQQPDRVAQRVHVERVGQPLVEPLLDVTLA